jgi:hypothetical protein
MLCAHQIAVKQVLLELKPLLSDEKLLVSIAAGVKMKDLQVSMLLEDNFLISVNLVVQLKVPELKMPNGNAFFFHISVFQFTRVVQYTKPLELCFG